MLNYVRLCLDSSWRKSKGLNSNACEKIQQEPSMDILYLPFSCFPLLFSVTGCFLNPSQVLVYVCEFSRLIIQYTVIASVEIFIRVTKNIPKF